MAYDHHIVTHDMPTIGALSVYNSSMTKYWIRVPANIQLLVYVMGWLQQRFNPNLSRWDARSPKTPMADLKYPAFLLGTAMLYRPRHNRLEAAKFLQWIYIDTHTHTLTHACTPTVAGGMPKHRSEGILGAWNACCLDVLARGVPSS